MASQTQQGLTLRCYINFEVITGGRDKNTLCILSNERDEILEVQVDDVLKGLGGSTVKQEDKRLHYGVESQKPVGQKSKDQVQG